MNYLIVADLSEFNGYIDWPTLAQNVDGVIVRAGYRGWGGGNIVKDSRCRELLVHAQAQGIPLGLYFVTQAINESEAAAEADFCANMAKDVPLRLPVFWDTELAGGAGGKGRADNLSAEQRTSCAMAFAKRARELGLNPGVYCSDSWLTDRLTAQWLRVDRLPLWLASYPARKGAVDVPPKNAWDAWQYTATGRVTGVTGDVDVSWFKRELFKGHFSDTAGHWAEEYINRVKEAGLMNGKSERLFAPNDVLTRAELAAVLCRLLDRMEAEQ